MPRHTTSVRRRILLLLLEAGPMTAAAMVRVFGSDTALVKTTCSKLARQGLLTEEMPPRGVRIGRKYGAAVTVLPVDVATVEELTAAYGAERMHELVEDAQPRVRVLEAELAAHLGPLAASKRPPICAIEAKLDALLGPL